MRSYSPKSLAPNVLPQCSWHVGTPTIFASNKLTSSSLYKAHLLTSTDVMKKYKTSCTKEHYLCKLLSPVLKGLSTSKTPLSTHPLALLASTGKHSELNIISLGEHIERPTSKVTGLSAEYLNTSLALSISLRRLSSGMSKYKGFVILFNTPISTPVYCRNCSVVKQNTENIEPWLIPSPFLHQEYSFLSFT